MGMGDVVQACKRQDLAESAVLHLLFLSLWTHADWNVNADSCDCTCCGIGNSGRRTFMFSSTLKILTKAASEEPYRTIVQ